MQIFASAVSTSLSLTLMLFLIPISETISPIFTFSSASCLKLLSEFAFLFSSVAIIFNNFSFFEKDDLINIISIDLKINQLNDFEKLLIQNTSKYKLISHSSLEKNQNINQYVYEIELINQNSLSKIYEETNKRGYINFKSIFGSSIINA